MGYFMGIRDGQHRDLMGFISWDLMGLPSGNLT